jgi:hypothetical protein
VFMFVPVFHCFFISLSFFNRFLPALLQSPIKSVFLLSFVINV